jgi:hypothetical protein
MTLPLSDILKKEQQAVEEQIRDAFRGVTRAGGVSWSESVEIDNCKGEAQRAIARTSDTEQRWEDLVDDPNWWHDFAVGGFNFLDSIGYAYYIAPAMIRCAREGHGEFVAHALAVDGDFKQQLANGINPIQARAIARFVRFMIATHTARGDDTYGDSWKYAYRVYWRQWDAGNARQ